MGLYARYILPHVIDRAMGQAVIADLRRAIVPEATGRVLEVGIGAGHNLAFYDPAKVEKVWGLEPSREIRARAAARVAQSPVPVEWLDLPGEAIPLDDASMDTVVVTFTLCSIGPVTEALHQMRRVLKPGARLLFSEHGAAPDAAVRRWQDRLTPIWKRLGGGCHLNRAIPDLIAAGGFAIDRMDTAYMPDAPRFLGFTYTGSAAPR